MSADRWRWELQFPTVSHHRLKSGGFACDVMESVAGFTVEADTSMIKASQASSRRHHLSLYPLHGARTDPYELGHLENAMTGTKLLTDRCLNLSTN